MNENPFWEPGDGEPTILRPVPGGGVAAPPGADRPRSATPPIAEPDIVVLPQIGGSRLLDIAAPLLQLLGRLRSTYSRPDPAAFRLRTVQAVHGFDAAAAANGIPLQIAVRARYALCASIDDIAMNTTWGKASKWIQTSLVAEFHHNVVAGEGFFEQLTRLKREPASNLILLELMYYCLSLGYEGQYRLFERGPADLKRVRDDLYATIASFRQPYDRDLSLHWKGVDAPYRIVRGAVPIWVMAATSVAIVALAFFLFLRQLNETSDEALRLAGMIPPLHMPAITRAAFAMPPSPQPATQSALSKKLHAFLQPEIDAKLVFVTEITPQQTEVRISNSGMFDSGSATVHDAFVPLLMKIGDALNDEPGLVVITGHTDDQPIHTIQFPSNYQLSAARAEAAAAIMVPRLHDPSRVTVKGLADMMPFDTSPTEEGRRQNRRIEIILNRRG